MGGTVSVLGVGEQIFVEVEINDQWEMVRGAFRERSANQAGFANEDVAAREGFIERTDGSVSGERTKLRGRSGDLFERVIGEWTFAESIAPVIRVPNDDGGDLSGFAEERVVEQMPHLPVTFLLGEAEMPVGDVQVPFGSFDHRELRSAGFAATESQRDLMMCLKRPARQQQVSVTAGADADIQLMHVRGGFEMFGQHLGLMVKLRTLDVQVDFLQADDVGVLLLDDRDDPFNLVAPVETADAFVDVVAKEAHIVG